MRKALLLALALAVAATPTMGQLSGREDLLDPERAFRIFARALDARHVEVEFRIAPGYYLYRDRFSFATDAGKPLADVQIPRGKIKEDQFLGRQETFRELVRISVPVSAADAAKGSITLQVTSQGCADQGVCYIPQTQRVKVDLPRP